MSGQSKSDCWAGIICGKAESHTGPQPFRMQTILSLGLCFCKMVYSIMAGDIRLSSLLSKASENLVLEVVIGNARCSFCSQYEILDLYFV